MSAVANGLQAAAWEGPATLAEELCLKAILHHASEVSVRAGNGRHRQETWVLRSECSPYPGVTLSRGSRIVSPSRQGRDALASQLIPDLRIRPVQ
jgi:hypothetical protein